MKTFTNFSSFMEGCCQGIASYFGTRLPRFDSLSLVSRQSVLAILLLCLTLGVGVGNVWGATFTKITSLSDLTTGNYVIVGRKGSASWGILRAGTISSSKLTYTQDYTSTPPNSITTTTANQIWYLTVSGSGTSRTVQIYSAAQNKYLSSAPGNLSYSNSGVDWTSKYSSGFSIYRGSTYYLGVNKDYNYWRDYMSGTLYNSSGYQLTLYKETTGYSITYHCNGGTSDCPSDATGQTKLPSTLPTPSRTGCTFAGWYTNEGLTTAAVEGATLSGNVDLYAKWTCDVTLNRNGVVDDTNTNIAVGTTLASLQGDGNQGGCAAWTFVGWSKTQRAAQNVSTEMTLVTTVDGPGPYYAVYSHTESGGTTTKNYSITFDDNGSDSSTDLTTSTFINEVSNNADSISSVTSVTKCYAGTGGLKMASQKQNGSFTLSLAHSLPIKKIVLNAKRGSTSGTFENGVTVGSTAFSTSSSYSADNFVDLEFTGTKTTSNSLTITSTSGTAAGSQNANRITRLKSITIYFEASGDVTYYSTTASCCTALDSINGSVLWTYPLRASPPLCRAA